MSQWFPTGWFAQKRATLRPDLTAGLLVAIVALPLSIGYAIASGVPPMLGIWASVVAGLIAAVFGGSEYQVSGPTGALVIVTLAIVTAHGLSALALTMLLAGVILLLMGALRLGKIIEYIPSPVIIGITAGIGVLILLGQIPNILGVTPDVPAGSRTVAKAVAAIAQSGTADLAGLLLAGLTILILAFAPRLRRTIPWSMIAIIITTALAIFVPWFGGVRTVESLGPISTAFPILDFGSLPWGLTLALLPAALTLAVLIAIESLLTAVHTDGMTGTRHKPNRELVGQGLGNAVAGAFGLMPSAGTAARTALNVRLGARSRVAAVANTILLLLLVLLAGPFIGRIPLAAIGGLLVFVAFNMIHWERIVRILRTPLSDIAVLVTTLVITITLGVTPALEVGLILAALLFMKRMSDLYNIDQREIDGDGSDSVVRRFSHPDVSIYTVPGPLFFGAAIRFDQQVTAAKDTKLFRIIRMKHVPVIDATGLEFLDSQLDKIRKSGGVLLLSAVHPDVMRVIRNAGLERRIGADRFFPATKAAIACALRLAHERKGEPPAVTDEEVARYDLAAYDVEETRPDSTHDKDPIEDILEQTGISYLTEFGHRTITRTVEMGQDALSTTVEAGKGALNTTVGVGKGVVSRTAQVTTDVTTKVIDATTNPLRRKSRSK